MARRPDFVFLSTAPPHTSTRTTITKLSQIDTADHPENQALSMSRNYRERQVQAVEVLAAAPGQGLELQALLAALGQGFELRVQKQD